MDVGNYTKISESDYTLIVLEVIDEIALCTMYTVLSLILLLVSCKMHKLYHVVLLFKPIYYKQYANKLVIYIFFICILLYSLCAVFGHFFAFISSLIKVVSIVQTPDFSSTSLAYFSPQVTVAIQFFHVLNLILEMASQVVFLFVFVCMLWLWFNTIDRLNVVLHRVVFVFRFMAIFCVIFITVFVAPSILLRHVPSNLLTSAFSVAHYYILIGVAIFFTLILDACILLLLFIVVWNSIFIQVRFNQNLKNNPLRWEQLSRLRFISFLMTFVMLCYLISCNLMTISYSLQIVRIRYFYMALAFHDAPGLITYMLSVLIVGPLDFFCLRSGYFSSHSDLMATEDMFAESDIETDVSTEQE